MNFTSIDLWLFSAIGILLILRASRALVFQSIARAKSQQCNEDENTASPHISIIITAHDQANELRHNLPLIFAQKYEGEFDVIVVNDASTDETEDVLKLMKQQHENFYYTFTPNSARYISHKKLAITIGAKAAKGEWLMLVEADSAPRSENWLSTMSKECRNGIDIIYGPTAYNSDEKRGFSKHIAFERLFVLIKQAYRFVHKKKVFRASGCNILIKADAFNANKGFMHNLQLKRGEDDLLVNEVATKDNFRMVVNSDAVIEQAEPIVYKIWKTDRIFYIETQKHIKGLSEFADKWLQAFHSLSLLLFITVNVGGIAWSIIQQNWFFLPIYPLTMIIAWTVNAIAIKSSAKAIDYNNTFCWTLPLYELWHIADEIRFRFQHMIRHKDEFMRQ